MGVRSEYVSRIGHQSLSISDGRKYVGERKYDKANGKGTYFWPSGDKYEGEFKNDKMHGKGRYTWVCHFNGAVVSSLFHILYESS